jgi:hypothetical protein
MIVTHTGIEIDIRLSECCFQYLIHTLPHGEPISQGPIRVGETRNIDDDDRSVERSRCQLRHYSSLQVDGLTWTVVDGSLLPERSQVQIGSCSQAPSSSACSWAVAVLTPAMAECRLDWRGAMQRTVGPPRSVVGGDGGGVLYGWLDRCCRFGGWLWVWAVGTCRASSAADPGAPDRLGSG